jgi:hypothetical protein
MVVSPVGRENGRSLNVRIGLFVPVAAVLLMPPTEGIQHHAQQRDESDDEQERIGHGAQRMTATNHACGVAISDPLARMARTTIVRHGEALDLR